MEEDSNFFLAVGEQESTVLNNIRDKIYDSSTLKCVLASNEYEEGETTSNYRTLNIHKIKSFESFYKIICTHFPTMTISEFLNKIQDIPGTDEIIEEINIRLKRVP